MNEKLKLALEKLEQNPELKEEVTKNPPKTVEEIIAIAARLGVTLTKEELEAEKMEMSLEELDQVAGGGKGKDFDTCGVGMGIVCGVAAGVAIFHRK